MLICIMSKVIALLNRKGGSIKSTSSAYIAQVLHNEGLKVACIDYDPEQSLMRWSSTGNLPFEVIEGNLDDLAEQVTELKDSYDFLVLDTPPNDKSVIMECATIADECIVPVNPTAMDSGRLLTTLKSIGAIEKVRNEALTSVVIVRAKSNTNILQEVRDMLQERNIPICDQTIKDSVRYQSNSTPSYLDEYKSVLKEIGVLDA